MPWKKVTAMDSRRDFVRLWSAGGLSMSELCRRFGVSRKTGYKWTGRFALEGLEGLEDRSRRPLRVRCPTPDAMVQEVMRAREERPAWGGRKIRRMLENEGQECVPSASTITSLLKKAGKIGSGEEGHGRASRRFEHCEPNAMWQMDFKGGATLSDRRVCQPLSVLDDHSRFALELKVCADQCWEGVHECITGVFERFGLPLALLMDNGTPWGNNQGGKYSRFDVWLMRLGVRPVHGRAYHPQTQGKVERFHGTLEGELMSCRSFHSVEEMQREMSAWREVYNHQRPHEALGMQTPGERYRPSPRPMPHMLPEISYSPCDHVRCADQTGLVRFEGRRLRVGQAFGGEQVGFRPTAVDGRWEVFFGSYKIGQVDLRQVGKGEFSFIGLSGSADSAGQSND